MSRRSNSREEMRPLVEGGAGNVDEEAAAKLLARFEVDAPDDLTVERVWQRVAKPTVARRGSQAWKIFGIAAPAVSLACVLVVGFVLLRRPGHLAQPSVRPTAQIVAQPVATVAAVAQSAQLAAAHGGVFFSRPAERWQLGEDGQTLAEGQSLRTDPSGEAVLDILGIASIFVTRGTDLAIERLSGGTFLRLTHGSVVARVSKRPPSEPFVILTDHFSVKVVGTLFRVDQDAIDRTTVTVREGVVEVTDADGHSWRVGAGQSWSSAAPEQMGAASIADPIRTLLEDGLRRASASDLEHDLQAVGVNAATEVAPAPALAPLRDAAPTRSVASVASFRRVAAESAPAPSGEAGPAFVPPPPSVLPSAPPSAPTTLAMREPLAAPDTRPSPPEPAPIPSAPEGAYSKGLALERSGQLEAAAAELARAEQEDAPHADLALYALGRLRQHRLHDARGALEAFTRYRASYPAGALMPEVDLAVLEVEVAAGHRKAALAESLRFLASHPASERTDEVRLVRGNLLRDEHQCGAAIAEYAQIAAPTFGEEALFETAYCQRKVGNAGAALESLRAYRARFPSGPHRDEVARELGR